MYAGNLYGGLLSFFTLLEMLEVTHLPMGGPHDDDYHEIARTIVNQGVTTLIGMPSTLYQLFTREEAILRDYGGIQKLLLGGEHMGVAQRDYIHGFGVKPFARRCMVRLMPGRWDMPVRIARMACFT